jgi:hypothetical protein
VQVVCGLHYLMAGGIDGVYQEALYTAAAHYACRWL